VRGKGVEMTIIVPTTFVRFIAARMQTNKETGNLFLSASVAGGDLANRFPEQKYMLSWTLDGADAMDKLNAGLNKHGVKLVFETKVENKPKAKDPRWVFKADGVLYLGIQLSVEPVVKRAARGTDKDTVDLKGILGAVQVRPKAKPNTIAL
jgi:hypothetical protein